MLLREDILTASRAGGCRKSSLFQSLLLPMGHDARPGRGKQGVACDSSATSGVAAPRSTTAHTCHVRLPYIYVARLRGSDASHRAKLLSRAPN